MTSVDPFSGERVPIYVANFVLMEYGTGAIMAVPAHDTRDFAFAKKYGLPIKTVIVPADKAGAAEQGADPAQAVVAIVVVLLQGVADQEALGGALVHVDPVDGVAGCAVIPGGFVFEGMAPVLDHARNALGQDQLGRVTLRVLRDGLVPVLADQRLASRSAQPFKGPFVMSAEIVDA